MKSLWAPLGPDRASASRMLSLSAVTVTVPSPTSTSSPLDAEAPPATKPSAIAAPKLATGAPLSELATCVVTASWSASTSTPPLKFAAPPARAMVWKSL